jgi:hypothetical protein
VDEKFRAFQRSVPPSGALHTSPTPWNQELGQCDARVVAAQ